ncbi:MAG: hypothetical protein ACD_11C00021G0001 [uncultured bacterium]|nr:MAG: hypothetical protein ACD_11C00021G0001 [uncultured bacterium]HBR71350.1 hypothetical protein [Candidatus Moranbacteria bacterium]
MFFHFRVLLHSIVFLLILEIFLNDSVSEFLASLISVKPVLFFVLLGVFFLFILNNSLKIGKSWDMVFIPILLYISSIGLSMFVDSDLKKHLFSALSFLVYYSCLLGIQRLKSSKKDQTARGLIASTAAASIFLFYSFVYGFYLNFTIPLWFVMLLFFSITTLVSYQYFNLLKEDKKTVWKYSLIIGMVMMEISLVANFWPFGYLTTGATMLIFYYILWDLIQSYFLKKFSKRRVIANITIFGSLMVLVLASSRWLPVV